MPTIPTTMHLTAALIQDSEPISASVYDGQMPATPVVQFDKFINDEPLVGTDIVSWYVLWSSAL